MAARWEEERRKMEAVEATRTAALFSELEAKSTLEVIEATHNTSMFLPGLEAASALASLRRSPYDAPPQPPGVRMRPSSGPPRTIAEAQLDDEHRKMLEAAETARKATLIRESPYNAPTQQPVRKRRPSSAMPGGTRVASIVRLPSWIMLPPAERQGR